MLASVSSVPFLISLVNVVCVCGIFRFLILKWTNRRLFLFPRTVAPVLHWSACSTIKAKASTDTLPVQSISVPKRAPVFNNS